MKQNIFNNKLVRNNIGSLPKYAMDAIDETLMRVYTASAIGVDLLQKNGLIHQLGDMGYTKTFYKRVGNLNTGVLSMTGKEKSQDDTVIFTDDSIPVPILKKDWSIDKRALISSKREGHGLDMVNAEEAAQVIVNMMEHLIFNGSTKFGISGLLNATSRVTVTNSASPKWQVANLSDLKVREDVLAMVMAMRKTNRSLSNLHLLVNTANYIALQSKGTNTQDEVILDSITSIPYIKSVVPTDSVPENEVLLIDLSKRTIDLAFASELPIINQQIDAGYWETRYSTFSVMTPRIKADHNGVTGIVHTEFTKANS